MSKFGFYSNRYLRCDIYRVSMWSAKISFDGSRNVAGGYVKARGVSMLVFPLGWSYEENGIEVTYSGVVFGDEKGKAGFFRDWKNDKKKRGMFRGWKRDEGGILKELEVNGDFFIGKAWEPLEGSGMFNRNLVYTRPWLIEKDGRQVIVVSSFQKKCLEEFILTMEKFHEVRVEYVRKAKVENVAFSLSAPSLTERQKWAMDLAISGGYYEVPRKVSISELARGNGVSFACFHEHLRKAERAMMPFWFGDE